MGKIDDILRATLKLVIQKGIHNTPMSLISKEAGVGMGTIYNYFKSKEVLINALYLKLKGEEAEHMLKDYKKGMSVRKSFFFFWNNIFNYFIIHPQEFQFLEQFYFSELTKVYEQGQQQEILKKGDILQQIYFTHGALASLAKFHILGDIQLDGEGIDKAITSAWDALKL